MFSFFQTTIHSHKQLHPIHFQISLHFIPAPSSPYLHPKPLLLCVSGDCVSGWPLCVSGACLCVYLVIVCPDVLCNERLEVSCSLTSVNPKSVVSVDMSVVKFRSEWVRLVSQTRPQFVCYCFLPTTPPAFSCSC